MDRKVSIIIATVSLAVAAGGVSFGVKAHQEKQQAEQRLHHLKANLTAQTPHPDETEGETDAVPLVETARMAAADTNVVAELQRQLDEREAELARLREQMEARSDDEREQRRQSWEERMARMKEEDPERYEEMIQRRTEFRERMRNDQFNRLNALAEIDTSMMTTEELANHALLIDKLSSLWEQTSAYDPEQPPDREAMREAFRTMRDVGDMMDMERNFMFRQLGADVGLTDGDADAFAGYVESIVETTTLRGPRGWGRRRDAD